MIIDAPKVFNKDEWVWNQYLSSEDGDPNNHYRYDQQLKKITLDQKMLDKDARDADAIFLAEKARREKEI